MEVIFMFLRTLARFLLLFGLFCSPSLLAHPRLQQDLPAEPLRPAEIPFKIVGQNMIIVNGRIGSLTNLKFGIDTGTTITVVDMQIVRKLAIKPTPGQVSQYGQPVPAGFLLLPEIVFGPVRAANHPVIAIDLSFTQTFRAHVDAIIGLDLLRRQNFTIDFRSATIRFATPPATDSVPMQFCEEHLTILASLDGHPIQLVIASALNDILLLPSDSAPYLLPIAKKHETSWPAANGGFVVARQLKLQNFRLGPSKIAGKTFLLSQPSSVPEHAYGGYLGTGALHARRLHFNFQNSTFSWER
jgi:hypothetical protein